MRPTKPVNRSPAPSDGAGQFRKGRYTDYPPGEVEEVEEAAPAPASQPRTAPDPFASKWERRSLHESLVAEEAGESGEDVTVDLRDEERSDDDPGPSTYYQRHSAHLPHRGNR